MRVALLGLKYVPYAFLIILSSTDSEIYADNHHHMLWYIYSNGPKYPMMDLQKPYEK